MFGALAAALSPEGPRHRGGPLARTFRIVEEPQGLRVHKNRTPNFKIIRLRSTTMRQGGNAASQRQMLYFTFLSALSAIRGNFIDGRPPLSSGIGCVGEFQSFLRGRVDAPTLIVAVVGRKCLESSTNQWIPALLNEHLIPTGSFLVDTVPEAVVDVLEGAANQELAQPRKGSAMLPALVADGKADDPRAE